MIISQTQIKELSEQLSTIITQKEEKLRSCLTDFRLWREVVKSLCESIKQIKPAVVAEEKDIQEMKAKFKELISLKEINTGNPVSSGKMTPFIETLSMINNRKNHIDGVNSYFEEMKELVNRKLNYKSLPDSPTEDSEFDCIKLHTKDMALGQPPIGRNRTLKKDCRSLTQPLFEFNSKHIKEALQLLATKKNMCLICKKASILELGCCKEVCAQCFKAKLKEQNKRILLNPFEADKMQVSMCVCPIHKVHIGVELLQKLFDPRELQMLSIETIKRQHIISKKIKYPTICVDCKAIMKDDLNAVKVCSKHKICNFCCMYFIEYLL